MSKLFRTKEEAWISSVGLVAVAAIFTIWCVTDEKVNKAGYLAAAVSVFLFTVICLRFVRNWVTSWKETEPEIEILQTSEPSRKTAAIIFAVFLAYDIAVLILIHLIRVIVFKDTTGFAEGLNLFLHIDTGYYLKIAEQWYVNSPDYIYDLAFFPGYPILIRTINSIIGNYLISSVAVSGIFYGGSAFLLYVFLSSVYSEKDAIRGVKYLAILPAAFFFAAPMSESLFLFLSILTIFLAKKEKWLTACIAGALSSFTRSLGVLVFAPMVFIAITGIIKDSGRKRIWVKRLAMTLIIPLGMAGYLLINYMITGDPFAYSEIQMEKWGQSMGLFFDTTAFQIDNALADIQQPYFTSALGIWFPNVAYCLAVLLLMVYSSKYLNPEYSLWFICYYAVAVGATYLISAPRYLVACMPLYPAVVLATKNKKADIALTALSVVTGAYYMFAFAARWEVF